MVPELVVGLPNGSIVATALSSLPRLLAQP